MLLLPVSGFSLTNQYDKKIAIDIGHSPQKYGAISARGLTEYSFNKAVAFEILQALRNLGYNQAYIVSVDKNISLSERIDIVHRKKSELLISIHHDSVQEQYLKFWMYSGKLLHYSDNFSGFSLFVADNQVSSVESKKIAMLIADRLLILGFKPTLHHAEDIPGEKKVLIDETRGIYRNNNLHILKAKKIPSILIECGVIVNRDEEAVISQPASQRRLAKCISSAIDDYFRHNILYKYNRLQSDSRLP